MKKKPVRKRCATCKQEKPLDAFHRNCGARDGLSYLCKDCKREYMHATKYRLRGFSLESLWRRLNERAGKARK